MSRTAMALFASLGLLLAGGAGAAETAKNGSEKEMSFEGDIVSVDVPAREFTVKSAEKNTAGEMTFLVGKSTSIRIDGATVLRGQLRKGEHVTVTYEVSGNTPVATHLHRHKKTT
jgi:hypothetical protein